MNGFVNIINLSYIAVQSFFVKLSPQLAQYLLTHKELKLPGLGTFYADNGAAEYASVRFEQNDGPGDFDEALVNYIAEETGKMKVLALSDLSSQLEDAIQFLNTGKPYLFTGIGTLLKKANGKYDFVSNTQMEAPKKKNVPFTERNTVPQAYIEEKHEAGAKSKKPLAIILVLIAIAAIGAFWFYNRTGTSNDAASVKEKPESQVAATSATTAIPDTSGTKPPVVTTTTPTAPSGMVTYVLETAKEPRASKRFNQLKKINWPVELEKLDSTQFNIIMNLATAPADTARVRDSLSAISGRKVKIRN